MSSVWPQNAGLTFASEVFRALALIRRESYFGLSGFEVTNRYAMHSLVVRARAVCLANRQPSFGSLQTAEIKQLLKL